MRTPARILAVALSGAIFPAAACVAHSENKPDLRPAPTQVAQPVGLKGQYTCSISGAGAAQSSSGAADTAQSPQSSSGTCRIVPGDVPGSLWLEKVSGAPRISGEVTKKGDGFSFSGDYYCPQGACDDEVDAQFVRVGAGAYRAQMTTKRGTVVVALKRKAGGAPVSAARR